MGFGEGEDETVGFSGEEGFPVWGGERQGFGGGRERGFRKRKSGIHCPGQIREDEDEGYDGCSQTEFNVIQYFHPDC